jgi:N-acetylmuramoyl-L-alanine amidase
MDLKKLGRATPLLIGLVVVAAIAVVAVTAALTDTRTAEAEYPATTSAPRTAVEAEAEVKAEVVRAGVAFVPPGGADLWLGPERDPYFRIHEGVALGFLHRTDDWLLVTTTCNDTAWVNADDVTVMPQTTRQATGAGFDLNKAVIVLDAGHGARDWGGVGPSGLSEKEVNLDITDRIRNLMESSQDIDWASGEITPGSTVPAFASVILTRDVVGPDEGDFEAGLGYRATLATAAGADAFISIHNNTVPRVDSDIPGSEVYYSIGAEDSDRLAGIIYEELLRSFSAFEADWSGGELPGARARIDPETEDDYYGLLRRATMPSVIVEGVYISEPEEEALLATPEFRDAYAAAVYRGVVRFLTTTDTAEVNDPEYFPDDAGTVTGNGCELPAQP